MAKKNLDLAKKALAAYKDDPGLTIDQLARELGVDHADALAIVSDHRVDADGKVTYAGPGAGGGWLAPGE